MKTETNKSLVISNQTPPDLTKEDLVFIRELVNDVETSDLAKPFLVEQPDGTMKVDRGSIIANMALARAMNIDMMVGLVLGKKLNANSYFAVLRGRALGLDPSVSMDKIYVIKDKISLAVDIISKAIIDAGGEIHLVRDYETVNTYKQLISGEYVGHYYQLCDKNGKLKDNIFIYNDSGMDAEEKKALAIETGKANKAGKLIVTKLGTTKVTSVRLVRKRTNYDETIHYSLQDATDAGLYSGVHSRTKEVVEGKDNWENHPASMLRNRPLSINGRIGFADKLQGAYSHEELMDILNVNSEKELANMQANTTVDAEFTEEK